MKSFFTTSLLLLVTIAYSQVVDQNQTALSSDLFSKGSLSLELNQFARAKYYFTAAIQNYSKNADYYYGLGLAHFYLDEYDSALLNMQAAITIDDKQSNFYYYKGAILAKSEDFKGAVSNYQQAISLNDGSDIKIDIANCKFQIGVCKMEMKHYSEGVEVFEGLITENPENDKAILNRGICMANLERFEKACDDFTKSALMGNKRAKVFLEKYCYKVNTVVVKN